MPRPPRLGLAQALYAKVRGVELVETEVADLLDELLPSSASRRGWVGWQFDRDVPTALGIQVYEVLVPYPAAIAALHRAGFAVVTLHPHSVHKLAVCACAPQISPT